MAVFLQVFEASRAMRAWRRSQRQGQRKRNVPPFAGGTQELS
jgi:hypothetical protein